MGKYQENEKQEMESQWLHVCVCEKESASHTIQKKSSGKAKNGVRQTEKGRKRERKRFILTPNTIENFLHSDTNFCTD